MMSQPTKPATIVEVAPGIFTVDHRVAAGKNVVIFGDRGAWAVDTGSDRAEGATLVELINTRGERPNRLIYTHGHGDHILGSAPFQGADVYAHALTPVEIERLLPTLAKRAGTTTTQLASQIAWPTVTFRDELCLDLGNREIQLFPTPGHSQDGISLYLPKEQLLIAGDSVVTGIVPAIGDGNSVVLEASLRKLQPLPIEVLVPGHGPVVYGREAVQDWLRWLPAYLYRVRSYVQQELRAGTPPTIIPERCSFATFVGDRLPRAQYKMPQRHRATVAKIVAESLQR